MQALLDPFEPISLSRSQELNSTRRTILNFLKYFPCNEFQGTLGKDGMT